MHLPIYAVAHTTQQQVSLCLQGPKLERTQSDVIIEVAARGEHFVGVWQQRPQMGSDEAANSNLVCCLLLQQCRVFCLLDQTGLLLPITIRSKMLNKACHVMV